MNSVNDKVQQLFCKYEDRVRKRRQSEPADDGKRLDEVLFEIQTLREFWDRRGWQWEMDRSLERKLKRSRYLGMWEQVQNKLAMRIETVSEADYWWTPARHQETVTLLWEMAGALRKAASPWWRPTATVAWHVVKELLVLGILVGILISSRGVFEVRVVALLILIYSSIRLEVGGLSFVLSNQVLMGGELRNLARSMKLKTPVDGLQADEKMGMGILLSHISALSGYLGCLIAIVALVYSLF